MTRVTVTTEDGQVLVDVTVPQAQAATIIAQQRRFFSIPVRVTAS
jgi:predicted secreted Zn-dependent protease